MDEQQLLNLMKFCRDIGADYADIRIKEILSERISVENGAVRSITKDRDKGAGIRVFVNGSLGFAATNDLETLEETARKAYEIAVASEMPGHEKHELSEKESIKNNYATEMAIDPFTVPLNEKLALLLSCSNEMMNVPGVAKSTAVRACRKITCNIL